LAVTYHYYPTESSVILVVRENQPACDECICLIFEALNSAGEKRFVELADKAKAGTVSKAEIVEAMMQQEFQAAKRMRDMLAAFKLGKKEQAQSSYYSRFIQCPSSFAEFVNYLRRVSPAQERSTQAFYAQRYDALKAAP